MHELAMVENIITIVQDEMAKSACSRIKEVNIRLGTLTGLDPEALMFGFETATAGSPLSGTRLVVDQISAKGRCLKCSVEFSIDDLVFLCPECSSHDVEILQGEEFHVECLVKE